MNERAHLSTGRGLIVVPVHNEETSLPAVIAGLKANFPSENLLFVDDGSSDGSQSVLECGAVAYVRHPLNLGYRESLITGMRYGLERDVDYVAFFDGDGQHRIVDLCRLLREFARGECDFLIGSRFLGRDGIQWNLRFLANQLFSRIASLSAGLSISDSTCGLKVISRHFLEVAATMPSEDFHAELVLGLSRQGARIREMAIQVEPRTTGISMYNFWKAVIYPARTLLCLVVSALPTERRGSHRG